MSVNRDGEGSVTHAVCGASVCASEWITTLNVSFHLTEEAFQANK